MRILIVEDEHKIAQALRKGLEQERYAIDLAYTGTDGYELATGEDYDLIILDLMLPKIDGWEVLAKIKGDHKVAHIPVVVHTVLEGEDHRKRAKSLGAHAFVNKYNDSLFLAIEKIFEEAEF